MSDAEGARNPGRSGISDALRDEFASRLDDALTSRTETPSLDGDPEIAPKLDLGAAYEVQRDVVSRRLARGESVVGVKLGFTSKAKMEQMGVDEIIVGTLTDAMAHGDGDSVDLARFIHPKIEPEVAYRVSADVPLDDPDVDILDYVDAVAPAMEIIDSRYKDFVFTFTDVIADNTSAAGYVLGQWQELRPVPDSPVALTVGDAEKSGSTRAILDDPENALRELLKMCRRYSIPLTAGYVILAGAATPALPLGRETATCEIDGLGSVSVTGR